MNNIEQVTAVLMKITEIKAISEKQLKYIAVWVNEYRH